MSFETLKLFLLNSRTQLDIEKPSSIWAPTSRRRRSGTPGPATNALFALFGVEHVYISKLYKNFSTFQLFQVKKLESGKAVF
jgi:hypothetical protein